MKSGTDPARQRYYRRIIVTCVGLALATLLLVVLSQLPRNSTFAWLRAWLGRGAYGQGVAAEGDSRTVLLPLLYGPEFTGYRVMVFSKTAGFRHASIPDAIGAIKGLGAQHNFSVDATEDAGAFNDANLARYRAVVFVMTTGDVLDDSQQAAFERYIRAGNGYVGIHSASDTEYTWPWYGNLVGAYFASHPAIQMASINIEDRTHPSTTGLPEPWVRTDEWYNFQSNPRSRVRVLARLDETTYTGGTMGDHPIAWCHSYDSGRAWYTAGGHTSESYVEPLFVQHILGGIEWASGVKPGDCQ